MIVKPLVEGPQNIIAGVFDGIPRYSVSKRLLVADPTQMLLMARSTVQSQRNTIFQLTLPITDTMDIPAVQLLNIPVSDQYSSVYVQDLNVGIFMSATVPAIAVKFDVSTVALVEQYAFSTTDGPIICAALSGSYIYAVSGSIPPQLIRMVPGTATAGLAKDTSVAVSSTAVATSLLVSNGYAYIPVDDSYATVWKIDATLMTVTSSVQLRSSPDSALLGN